MLGKPRKGLWSQQSLAASIFCDCTPSSCCPWAHACVPRWCTFNIKLPSPAGQHLCPLMLFWELTLEGITPIFPCSGPGSGHIELGPRPPPEHHLEESWVQKFGAIVLSLDMKRIEGVLEHAPVGMGLQTSRLPMGTLRSSSTSQLGPPIVHP